MNIFTVENKQIRITHILLISLLCIFFCGNAAAKLSKMKNGGDLVIYDSLSGLYWYPYIDEFIGYTKDEQLDMIKALDYAGSTDWYMASHTDTTLLKQSLAMMATKELRPTSWGDFGGIDTGFRGFRSPSLAYKVESAEFFTPTYSIPEGRFWSGFTPAYVFNGRTNTVNGLTETGEVDDDVAGGVTIGVPGYGNGVLAISNSADDHWVAHSLLTPNHPYQTMLFNFDQHYVEDYSTGRDTFPYAIGAWVVTRSIGTKD